MTTTLSAAIIGCGIIGASVAWELSRRGAKVTCIDADPGGGATWAAAGMLAAVTESSFGEYDLARMNVASASMWPEFAETLADESGEPVGMAQTGTLTVAFDPDDRRRLQRVVRLQQKWNLDAREISVDDARALEPSLGPRIAGAVWAPGDHQVDPRTTHHALMRALDRQAVRVVRRRVATLSQGPTGRVNGVVDDTGHHYTADVVILAAGWTSRTLTPNTGGPAVPTRPVKGQLVRLHVPDGHQFQLHRVVRGLVQDRPIYLVPRTNGEIVVGATSEEQPDDRTVTAGGMFAVLRDARALIPGIDELPITDVTARARPGTPDNLPLIGPSSVPGLVLATGHYRNGILLAPLTARAVAASVFGEPVPEPAGAAAPSRFSEFGAAAGSHSQAGTSTPSGPSTDTGFSTPPRPTMRAEPSLRAESGPPHLPSAAKGDPRQ